MESEADKRGLIDTDILIDALKGVEQSKQFLFKQQVQDDIYISIITAMELVRGSRNTADLESIREFLRTLRVLPIGRSASQKAYEWIESFALSHGLHIPDALIAATALEHELTLFTRNIRHFQMIPDIDIQCPY